MANPESPISRPITRPREDIPPLMSEPSPSPEPIDLSRADDPRDVVHRAVACLAGGGVVGLPTGAGYALAASALKPEAVARLASALRSGGEAGLDPGLGPWICLRGDDLLDWIPRPPDAARKVASRAWPGPAVLLLDDAEGAGLASRLPAESRSALIGPGGTLGLCCPEHPFVEHVSRLLSGPIALAEPRLPEGSALDSAAALTRFDSTPELLIDDGPPRDTTGPTVIAFPEGVPTVARAGAYSPAALVQLAGTVVVFVCTGNTCRSPMAEALFKALLASRLGCRPEELASRGWVVLSAGLSASHGSPAAAHAAEVVRAFGGSLDQHASRRLSPDLVRAADRLVVMTRDHLDYLLAIAPEAAPRPPSRPRRPRHRRPRRLRLRHLPHHRRGHPPPPRTARRRAARLMHAAIDPGHPEQKRPRSNAARPPMPASPFHRAFYLTGPTASGKTAVGVALADRLGAEVVALDSMTLYRGMDIGTAKPTRRPSGGGSRIT